MKIISIKFADKNQGWHFDQINFFNLTLLVGVSGVGKTQILKSILALKEIANGDSLNGIKWEINFETLNNKTYHWQGEFEEIKTKSPVHNLVESENEDEAKPKILYEKLILDNDLIIEKKPEGSIFFRKKKMPKLSSQESIIKIFREEDDVKLVYDGFKKIIFRDHTSKEGFRWGIIDIDKIKQKYKTLKDIQESDLETNLKLACVYDNVPEVFEKIKTKFTTVFEQVEDIKVTPIEDDGVPSFLANTPIIQIKEKNSWIPQSRISSGMLRTFFHISEMFLWSQGTIILIDEFENSLGVNCINVLTDDLIFENDHIQFIATSHHPYIINKIPYDYWKIINREGSKIIAYDAKDFDLGESHHERFMNLINLPQYTGNII
jgi:hypothetical protein